MGKRSGKPAQRKDAANPRAAIPTAVEEALQTTTPERLRRSLHVVEVRDGEGRGRQPPLGVRMLDATPLDAYRRRGVVDERQHEAGMWLARCFRRAVLQPSMIAVYGERMGGGGGADPMLDGRNILWNFLLASGLAVRGGGAEAAKADARVREALPGARSPLVVTPLGHVALSVCGLEEWAGGTRNLNKLRSALDKVADHLRIGHGSPAAGTVPDAKPAF
ncbi:hypothetical protein J2847_000832 [Azospirillum agricola]|uniref:hypothetical protein n=1 Tax=Azospirillum agricola TaxID=1720247 RepID=UPI001AE83B51|nr:hypothetical protein [Azospirillum agricola]MBP2227552.1 hypothetical protein [Azospirillum agricola]